MRPFAPIRYPRFPGGKLEHHVRIKRSIQNSKQALTASTQKRYIFCFVFIFALYLHYKRKTKENMTSMTFRVDDELKMNFDRLCDMFGLSNSAALNIFMKAVVRERRIPFEIRADSEGESRQRGWQAFQRMRRQAIGSGSADMTLEEINEEISAVRNGK